MRVQRPSLNLSWAVIACAGLGACSVEPPPPVTGALGTYQPATLAEAVLLRDTTAVENFLALGADPNEPETDGTTPLMRAVHGQLPDITRLLIDGGAYVRKANTYGVTPLYVAARAGDFDSTRMLLEAGADANATLPSGETVLMTAARAGNPEVVRALLTGGAAGVSLAAIAAARAAAHVAESGGYAPPTNPAVTANYAEVDARERMYGRTALMVAAAEGHLGIVELLIEAGSDLNVLDEEGASALSLARDYGHLDVAAKLAEAGGR
jgi:ankyrin repeat protein